MTVTNLRGLLVSGTVGSWVNGANSYDGTAGTNPATYATWTSAVSGAIASIDIKYAAGDIFGDANDVVNSVTITTRSLVNTVARFASANVRAYVLTTPVAAATALTLTTTAHNDTAVINPTYAQLTSTDFLIRLTVTKAATTQSGVFSLDHIDIAIDWTPYVAPKTWFGGSTGLIGVAGISDAFILVPPPQDWSGSTATIGMAGISGDFTATGPPQTWSGSQAALGVVSLSGEFILPIEGSRTLESDLTRRLEDNVYRLTEELAAVPQTWSGSTGTIGVSGTSGAFTVGPVSWSGSTATVGVAGTSNAFISGPVSWSGDTATIGVAGTSGNFIPGNVVWGGGTPVDLWEPFNNFTDAPWLTPTGWTIVAGRTGSCAESVGTQHIRYAIPPAMESATVTVGFAWWTSNLATPTIRDIMAVESDAAATVHDAIRAYADGHLDIRRGPSAILGSTAAGLVTSNTWYYIELKVVLSDTVGIVNLSVNGIPQLTLTNQDTKSAGTKTVFDRIHINGAGTAPTATRYDDLYLMMGSGGVFLGDITAPPVAGDIATLAVAATSGSFITAGGPQTWSGGSIATLGVAGISGAFVITAPPTGNRNLESNVLRITEGNIGRNLEGVDILVVIGQYNGQDVYELMYGSEPVEDWVLV